MFLQQKHHDQKEALWKEHWVAQRKLPWRKWTKPVRSNLKIKAQLEEENWVHQSMLFLLLNLKFRLSSRNLSRMEKRKRVLPRNQLMALLVQIRVKIRFMMRMFSQVPLFSKLSLNVLLVIPNKVNLNLLANQTSTLMASNKSISKKQM